MSTMYTKYNFIDISIVNNGKKLYSIHTVHKYSLHQFFYKHIYVCKVKRVWYLVRDTTLHFNWTEKYINKIFDIHGRKFFSLFPIFFAGYGCDDGVDTIENKLHISVFAITLSNTILGHMNALPSSHHVLHSRTLFR